MGERNRLTKRTEVQGEREEFKREKKVYTGRESLWTKSEEKPGQTGGGGGTMWRPWNFSDKFN